MNLSMEWLSEFVKLGNIDTKDYCDRMTATGSKVEGWETLADDIVNVAVGKILKVEKHPDADKLVICQIDVGEDCPRQIVTGAKNVFEGAYVPVAKAPAELPGGVKIKKGKLRGVESNGMLCSIAELNLTLHDMPSAIEDGILILSDDELAGSLTPGMDIRELLRLRDTVVEFEITPNRPDCLSMIGLARETSASFESPLALHTPEVKGVEGKISDYISVNISAPDLCRRYTARVVKNVKIAPSPLWMRIRLRAAGVRPINNIVDITNYVMLEYGQPMHAFDYSCLTGSKIDVRRARAGEQFRSLDDIDHTLTDTMLVISDENRAVALAGVMGGANSEIKDGTSTVVFESANFAGAEVRVTSRALGMRTESSGRFEKGLDPECTYAALQRACELVELLGAGEVIGTNAGDGIIDCYPEKWTQTVLPLEYERINAFLGVNLTRDFMVEALTWLGFDINGGEIRVPSWRGDVSTMNDLAEEVIRIKGYDTIEATRFTARVRPGRFTERQQYRHRTADMLCGLGYNEIYTFSFISPKFYDRAGMAENDPLRRSVVISNPLGEDTSVMRTTLLPSMLETLARNNNYHADAVRLYEIAAVYIPTDDPAKLPDEHYQLSLGLYGDGDFYTLKGAVENVFADAGLKNVRYTACTDDPTFHPGRCAVALSEDGAVLARFGELHPDVAKAYGFDGRAY
ncbi:MAG: phenylalanine--tRNA ligase subunit beta, partial [Eubacteriales bacterium]